MHKCIARNVHLKFLLGAADLKLTKNIRRRKFARDVTVYGQAETDGTPETKEYSHSMTYDHPTYDQPEFQPIFPYKTMNSHYYKNAIKISF